MQEDMKNKTSEFFHQRISRINAEFKKRLPSNEYALVCINNKGSYGSARYGILQDKALIMP
jgi:hypothetical protein